MTIEQEIKQAQTVKELDRIESYLIYWLDEHNEPQSAVEYRERCLKMCRQKLSETEDEK